jgi:4-aminobutyrate aminotransferase/(S)-3-amino-2-methylpropionate transaminase
MLQAGTFDNIVRILPPLVISEDLLVEGLEVLEKALRSL